MKFETPKMAINVFSENVLTDASGGIESSQTVEAAKTVLATEHSIDKANNILTFTFGE